MNNIATIPTASLATLDDPALVHQEWVRADTLSKLFTGDRAQVELNQRVILKHRNEAGRRLGQLYNELPFGQKTKFQRELDLKKSDVAKIVSLASITEATWTVRKDKDGQQLYAGTQWGNQLQSSLDMQKKRCASHAAIARGPLDTLKVLDQKITAMSCPQKRELCELLERVRALLKEAEQYKRQQELDDADADVIEF